MEYDLRLSQAREEIRPAAGVTLIHEVLLERFVFLFVAVRSLERDWVNLDLQRYNQLLGIWLKVSSDLLEQYGEIFKNGAPDDIFVDEVMKVIVEEVDDGPTLQRIRDRLAAAQAVK